MRIPPKDLFHFVFAACLAIHFTFSDSFEESRPYRPVKVFKVDKKVVYGVDSAEIYLLIEPRFAISKCLLELSSSHPNDLSIEAKDGATSTVRIQAILADNVPLRFVHRVLKTGEFSIGAISLSLKFGYPTEEVRGWIDSNTFRYADKRRRDQLMQSLPKQGSEAEETVGVFVYGRKFLK